MKMNFRWLVIATSLLSMRHIALRNTFWIYYITHANVTPCTLTHVKHIHHKLRSRYSNVWQKSEVSGYWVNKLDVPTVLWMFVCLRVCSCFVLFRLSLLTSCGYRFACFIGGCIMFAGPIRARCLSFCSNGMLFVSITNDICGRTTKAILKYFSQK